MKELSIKEYCEKYRYSTTYVSNQCKAGTWTELPDIKSIRKIGNYWFITLKSTVVSELTAP